MSDLNDYLDGRMSAGEREAFERRLESDPELGRRLAAAHEVREALRSDDEDLSPGFYTRAVARFEESRRPRTRLPFGLTWSTAGLAAAGLAAAAIFIPLMLRDEIPMPEKTAAEDRVDSALEEALADGAADPAAPRGRVVTDDETNAPADLEGRTESADADGFADDVDTREMPAPAPARVEESKITVDELRHDVSRPMEKRRQAKESSVPPPPAPERAEPMPAEAATAVEMEEDAEGGFANYRAVVGGVATTGGKDDQGAEKDSRPLAVATLPDDQVAPGVVWLSGVTIESKTADEQGDVFRLSGAAALTQAALPPDRFLTIGRRPGLDRCDELRLKAHATHWEVSFDEAGSAEGRVACGLLIPDDGREIRFMGERVDE